MNHTGDEVYVEPRPWPGEPTLNPTALLCLVVNDLKLSVELVREEAGDCPRLPVWDFFRIYQHPSGPALAGGAMGAPVAAMVVEKLFALGVDNLFFLGWAGSLSPQIPAGSIICPTWGAAEEGISGHYPVPGRPEADPDLVRTLEQTARGHGRELIKGPVWTTDAIYRESKAKAAAYRAEGFLAVEMEVSALLAISRFRGKKAAGLLVISDELSGPAWRPGFDLPQVEQARRLAARIALEATLNVRTQPE